MPRHTAPHRAPLRQAWPITVAETVARLYTLAMQISVTKDKYPGHARSPWLVVVPRRLSATGRRTYRRFPTRAAAADFAASLRQQVRANGEKPLAHIAADLAADARAAAGLLVGTGLSLTEAVRRFLAAPKVESVASRTYASTSGGAGEIPAAGPTWAEAFATVETAKAHQSLATRRTRATVRAAIFSRVPGFADRRLTDCTTEYMQQCLDAAWGHSPSCWNTARCHLHSVYQYALNRRTIMGLNPITPLERQRHQEAEIHPLHPQDLRRLFAACRPPTDAEKAAARGQSGVEHQLLAADTSDLKAYIAICALAGIRPTECSRITWGDVNLEENLISVRSPQSKTGGTRHITMNPALAAWLRHARPADPAHSDPIARPANLNVRLRAVRRRAGYGPGGDTWQNDCLRHSYATYFLLAGGNLHQLQLNMGHRDAHLLYQRYTNMRGITRAMAHDWWQILPPSTPTGARG